MDQQERDGGRAPGAAASGEAEVTCMNRLAMSQPASPAEQVALSAARAGQGPCLCGDSGISPAEAARLKMYLAAHPWQQFGYDKETGISVLVAVRAFGDPEVIASADGLAGLLDRADAPLAPLFPAACPGQLELDEYQRMKSEFYRVVSETRGEPSQAGQQPDQEKPPDSIDHSSGVPFPR